MRAGEAVERLLAAAPVSLTWPRGTREPYGACFVDPSAEVRRVLYCVTISAAVEAHFLDGGYDLLVAHHPFEPAREIPSVLLHTPLDCCEGGLNDMWRDALGLRNARHIIDNLGWYGDIDPVPFEQLRQRVAAFAGDILGQVNPRAETVRSVAVCSGLGGLVVGEAEATRADVYVTGELVQPAGLLDMGVIEVGHTLSERIGARRIAEVLPGVQVDTAPLEIDRFGGEVYHR